MHNAHDYNITIRHGVFEDEPCYEARVRELPDIVEYGDTFEEAYELAIDAIETTAEIMAEKGRPMPQPMDIPDDFSGRVTLRLPKTLHRRLAQDAEEEGISLNAYLVYVLTHFSGLVTGAQSPERPASWKRVEQSDVAVGSRRPSLRLVRQTSINQEIEWRETA